MLFTLFYVKFKTKPFKHQLEIFERQKDCEHFAYLWDRGLGKSKEILDTVAHLYCEGKIKNFVVIGPKSAYGDWKRKHVPEHLSDDVGAYIVYEWIGDTRTKDRKALEAFVSKSPKVFKIFAINTEAFQHPKIMNYINQFITSGDTLICLDESHLAKNTQAKRTKALKKVFAKCQYRRIATGTLMERVEDIYSQFDLLKSGLLGYTRFTAFKARYCEMKRMKFGSRPAFDMVTGYKHLDELQDKIKQHASILDKTDVFDLPPKVYYTLEVELTKEQKKYYDEMEKSFTTYINGQEVETNTVLTMALKLHQITCGVLHTDDGYEIIPGPNPKMEAMKEILDEGQKTLIFCNSSSNPAIENIYNTIKDKYSSELFYGKTSFEERERIKKAMQESDLQCIVANKTMAEGVTLTKAKNTIYFSNSYEIIKRDQSEDRNHRYGVQHQVNIIDIVAKGTIDEKIVAALRSKKSLADSLLGVNK